MTTLQEVARAAGVSKSVASRVLNHDSTARIAQKTRERVVLTAARLAYVPDHRALALRTRRSGAIALVVPEVTNSVFAELFAGVQQEAAASDTTVLLGELYDEVDRSYPLARIVDQGRVDGAILQRRETTDDATLSLLVGINAPVVLFNSLLPGRISSVTLDDARAAFIATQHLLDLGHSRIGFVGGTRMHDAARRRLDGYRSAMKAAAKRVDQDWVIEAGWEAPAGERAVDALLSIRRPPTGIVVASVNAALGALSRATKAGVEVPRQLSIVALQDTWFARLMMPALTVVKMPLREAGVAAAHALLAQIDGAKSRDIVVTNPAPLLITRNSTMRL